ncbi:glycosyltransferase family 39 protein [Aggregatilinea lenta]|uniref:glycosyltransferase family 39 protein n=1 Tax=Aggregatilinea lenta TaxID=913108 RepID=UPI0013C3094F|nr:glycosyltransferase family 39 protein [Aggregatilinea lenta]
MRSARGRGWMLPALALVLLLAAGLRFHLLGAQSLWNDEGNSLRLAQRGVSDLIDAAGRDIHPPGYYLLLKAWIAGAGTTEFALRALSALEGLIAVALAIALGRALFARPAGIAAGLLVALSPLAVYYSQETRMYAQLALLAVASMWIFVVWLRRFSVFLDEAPPPSLSLPGFLSAKESRAFFWLLALGLCNAAGMYTQYSFAFTLAAQVVWLLVWSAARRLDRTAQRALIAYGAAGLLSLALFLPWLPTAWDQVTAWPRTGVEMAVSEQARAVLTWITVGNTAGTVGWAILLLPLLLAALSLIPPRGSRRKDVLWRASLPLAWAGIGVAALVASGAYREANLKFLLPAQIALAVSLGGGLWRAWHVVSGPYPGTLSNQVGEGSTPYEASRPFPPRVWGKGMGDGGRFFAPTAFLRLAALALTGLLVTGQIAALDALYTDPAYARDDYRAMAARITAEARPGDAVILDAPNQAEVFSYYYHGAAAVYELPRGLGGDDDATRAEVRAVIAAHDRIWVLFWGEQERDSRRVVQATLDAETFPVRSEWYGDVRLAEYAVLAEPPAAPDVTLNALFGDRVALDGYALSDDAAQPGDVVGVSLFWRADAPLDVRYKVTVQLLAPDGSLVDQHDAEPGNNQRPTVTWEPGETVIDPHGLAVPPDAPPGDYAIIVGVYDAANPKQRLSVTGDGAAADHLDLAALTVR